MLAHQQRVVDERDELAGRLERLSAFIHGPRFADVPDMEQRLLVAQRVHMRHYLDVLERRIAAWGAA